MTDKDILSELDKKVIQGRRLGVFDNRPGQKLLNLYGKGILDPWASGQIISRVDKQLRKEAFKGIPFERPRLNAGELVFGRHNNKPIMYPVQYFNAGALLVANTGSGKTTLLCFYAVQIANYVKGMWLVDLRKKEFRLLKTLFDNMGIELHIIRSSKLKINPLQVPYKVQPKEYASTISDVLVKVLNLPPRASVLLSSTIIKLYKKFNIFNGACKYPTLFHLFEAVRLDRDANSQSRQAVLDNLESVLLTLGTEVLGYYRGWSIHELAQKHIVFELTGSSEAGKDLVLNYLVAAEFSSRIARGISNQDMDLWMSIDEGQRLFSQGKESSGYGGNSITDLAGLVRGSGTGLFISVLTTDDLSSRIPAITSTKIMGRCGSIKEYKEAGQFMGLNAEQVTWCAHNMVPGKFVAQASQGQWRYPFVFDVPKMSQLKVVTDIQADQSLLSLDSLTVEPVEFSDWSAAQPITVESACKSETTIQLTAPQMRLLTAIVNNPMLPSSQYVKLAGISPNTLSKLRPVFIEKGFIIEHTMDPGNRGRSKRIWEPLELAKQIASGSEIR